METILKVFIEKDKNRLVLRASGFVTPKQSESIAVQFTNALDEITKTNKQFTILIDLRGFKASSPEVQTNILKVQDAFIHSHAEKIASVVDSAITTMQLERIGKINNIERYLMRFNDLNDAAKWLDETESK